MLYPQPIMLKTVSAGGQLMLGRQYSGRRFEVEDLASGELVLHSVRTVCEKVVPRLDRSAGDPAFQIALVDQVILPSREQRNSRTG